jgi:hypothetical protein
MVTSFCGKWDIISAIVWWIPLCKCQNLTQLFKNICKPKFLENTILYAKIHFNKSMNYSTPQCQNCLRYTTVSKMLDQNSNRNFLNVLIAQNLCSERQVAPHFSLSLIHVPAQGFEQGDRDNLWGQARLKS